MASTRFHEKQYCFGRRKKNPPGINYCLKNKETKIKCLSLMFHLRLQPLLWLHRHPLQAETMLDEVTTFAPLFSVRCASNMKDAAHLRRLRAITTSGLPGATIQQTVNTSPSCHVKNVQFSQCNQSSNMSHSKMCIAQTKSEFKGGSKTLSYLQPHKYVHVIHIKHLLCP